jgi:hypothetical protein
VNKSKAAHLKLEKDAVKKAREKLKYKLEIIDDLPDDANYAMVYDFGYRTKAGVKFELEGPLWRHHLWQLLKQFKPAQLQLFKDSCTSFFALDLMTEYEKEKCAKGMASSTDVAPVTFKFDYGEVKVQWFHQLSSGRWLNIDVQLKKQSDIAKPVRRVKIVYGGSYGGTREVFDKWDLDTFFKVQPTLIRWYGGNPATPNNFTMYWPSAVTLEDILREEEEKTDG